MKNAQAYARRLRRVLTAVRPYAGKAGHRGPAEDVTEQLIRSLLARHAGDAGAASAYHRLMEAVVDLNELRVTPSADVSDILGSHFPNARAAGESVVRVLIAIFNRCHHLDLNFLREQPRREARQYLDGLDGINEFAAATTVLRGLGHPAFPVDGATLQWLRKSNLVAPEATHAEVQTFFEKLVSPTRHDAVSTALRRYVAAKAARQTRRPARKTRTAKRARRHHPKPVRPRKTRPRPKAAKRRSRPSASATRKKKGPSRRKSARRGARRR